MTTAKRGVFVPLWAVCASVGLVVVLLLAVGLGTYFGVRGTYELQTTVVSRPTGQQSTNVPTESSETTGVTSTEKPTPAGWRLPRTIFPNSYDLTIQPFLPPALQPTDPSCFTFNGSLTISLRSTTPTDEITMNMKDLNIRTSTLRLTEEATGQTVPLQAIPFRVLATYEMITFFVGQSLVPTKNYLLSFEYTGNLSHVQSTDGFYWIDYSEAGQTKYMAVTQFQCCSARMALPCFDEPEFKAVFNVSIVHPVNLTALSNSEMKETTDVSPAWKKTVFKPTEKMSSYLLAFVVAEISAREVASSQKVQFRIWAEPTAFDQTEVAATLAPKALQFYVDSFKQPYPLSKIDMVAVAQGKMGGMENWGLIVFTSKYLLYSNKTCWQATYDEAFRLIAHELSHQWFGNLVTMKWWNDLWLNEGFATLYEFLAPAALENDENKWNRLFVWKIHQVALEEDLPGSRTIYGNVTTPAEIMDIFDDITYKKQYIKKHAYQSTDHNQLWATIDEVISQLPEADHAFNVSHNMNGWMTQAGYPLLTVTRDYQNRSATISQKRFSIDPADRSSSLWYVPIWYEQQGAANESEASITGQQKSITIEGLSEGWLLVNSQTRSLCRVNYDEKNWDLLYDQLMQDHTQIDEISRAQLLNDAFGLASAGLVPYARALNLTRYLKKETSTLPWLTFKTIIDYLVVMTYREKKFIYVREYLTNVVKSCYDRFDAINDEYMKNLIFELGCILQHPPALKLARAQFAGFQESCNTSSIGSSVCSKVPTTIRNMVYCMGAAEGDYDEWNFLWNLYINEPQVHERQHLLYGLSCTHQPYLIDRLIDDIFSEQPAITAQDVSQLVTDLQDNMIAALMMWDLDINNFDKMIKKQLDQTAMKNFFSVSARTFNTQYRLDQIENWYNKYQNVSEVQSVLATLYFTVKINVHWMKKFYPTVIQWFQNETSVTAV